MKAIALNATAPVKLPTRHGDFTLQVFTDAAGHEHMALLAGTPADGCLVRLHSECATGDLFGSQRCDCGLQLEQAISMMAKAGNGVLLYLRGHEGRGIGLANKIKAYALQDQGMDTVAANLHLGFAADDRDYAMAAAILKSLGLSAIKLLTNNPAKMTALTAAGIKILERVPLWTADNPHNRDYLAVKRRLLGHQY
jgi:3,4-dihydroxy 2-butanone 4-phosphate synthase / GTP cyclohydrolase II